MKFTKLEVAYEHPAKGKQHCADCAHFQVLAPKHCEIVQGIIQPEDWCTKFKEKVMAEEKKKKHAKHGYHRTEIEHHGDGSHTVRHHPHPDHHEMPVKSYAAADLDAVHDGLEDNMGEPNPGEEADEAGVPHAPAQE